MGLARGLSREAGLHDKWKARVTTAGSVTSHKEEMIYIWGNAHHEAIRAIVIPINLPHAWIIGTQVVVPEAQGFAKTGDGNPTEDGQAEFHP